MTPPHEREVVLLADGATRGARAATYAGRALRLLREAGLDPTPVRGRDLGECRDLARDVVRSGVDTLVVCGGDALVQVGADAVAGSTVRLGVVPAGAGNALARAVGLSTRDPGAAVAAVVAGRERRLDLMRVGGRHVATVLSAGLDAAVSERAEQLAWPRGRLRYGLAVLDRLRALAPSGYTLELDGETARVEATLVAVASTPTFAGGLRIAEGADPSDGLLDVVVVPPMTRRELARASPALLGGGDARWSTRRARRVTVAAPGVVAYADGERIGPLPLSVEAAPGALRVLGP